MTEAQFGSPNPPFASPHGEAFPGPVTNRTTLSVSVSSHDSPGVFGRRVLWDRRQLREARDAADVLAEGQHPQHRSGQDCSVVDRVDDLDHHGLDVLRLLPVDLDQSPGKGGCDLFKPVEDQSGAHQSRRRVQGLRHRGRCSAKSRDRSLRLSFRSFNACRASLAKAATTSLSLIHSSAVSRIGGVS